MKVKGLIRTDVEVDVKEFLQVLYDNYIKSCLHQYGLYDNITLSDDNNFIGTNYISYNDSAIDTVIRPAREKEIIIINSILALLKEPEELAKIKNHW
jgi:hypothetical protein